MRIRVFVTPRSHDRELNMCFETEEEYLLTLVPGDFIEWDKKMWAYSHKSLHYLKSDPEKSYMGTLAIVFLYVRETE